jgi:tetratricopeptide (TPR) repeat protein
MRIALLALALALFAPAPALADAPPPTPEQIEAAKKAFAEGKKLHSERKYAEAIEKFKESYRLSRNPLLLYNIGFTMDEAKEADMALYYYRKFLKEAPPEAEQRALATERVKVLEEQLNPTPTAPEQVTPDQPDGPKQPVVIKPPGTYGATDFEHQIIDTAPPAKPLDVTAFVPEDSGFTVTLFYRTAGEGKYASKQMTWRYKELVGRIPAPKMIGTAVHYYIEVKDTTGALVTRSGKSTSPNLVNLEAGATPRFYPDLSEDGDTVLTTSEIRSRDDEDDPLNRGKKPEPEPKDEATPTATKLAVQAPPPRPRDGFNDVGSRKFTYAKWGSTGVAGALVGLSVAFYFQASSYSRSVESDIRECGRPPCLIYDQYASDLAATGKRYQTMSLLSINAGIIVGAVAGYFWLEENRVRRRGEPRRLEKAPPSKAMSWDVAPVIGGGPGGLVGATAARRF